MMGHSAVFSMSLLLVAATVIVLYDGEIEGGALDYFYFSITTYTTLGVGDLHPRGPLRLIAGVESLNGLVLTGWSASFTYLAMASPGEPRAGWRSRRV